MSMPEKLRSFSLFSSRYQKKLIFSVSILLIAGLEVVVLDIPAQPNPSNPNLIQCLSILVGGRL
jgi:hypothetical protein